MDIDYIFASAIFFLFIIWAVFAYAGLLHTEGSGIGMDAENVMERIQDSITAEISEVPLIYEAGSDSNGSVLYADFMWPGQENTARILADGTDIPCMFSQGRVYWKSDLNAGTNIFALLFGNFSAPLQCGSSFSTENSTRADMLAAERKRMAVQGKIDGLLASDYDVFRVENRISQGFRAEINQSGIIKSFGAEIPDRRQASGKESAYNEYSSGERIGIKVLVWR